MFYNIDHSKTLHKFVLANTVAELETFFAHDRQKQLTSDHRGTWL